MELCGGITLAQRHQLAQAGLKSNLIDSAAFIGFPSVRHGKHFIQWLIKVRCVQRNRSGREPSPITNQSTFSSRTSESGPNIANNETPSARHLSTKASRRASSDTGECKTSFWARDMG